jgi:Uma2 family endonuclease
MSRSRYEQMIESGIFEPSDRVELLDGLLIAKEPQGSWHASTVSQVRAVLQRAFGPAYDVRVGSPVALDDMSEPEPDLAVVPGRPAAYRHAHPARAALLVEVAESSVHKDRALKARLYARAGVADYWIVNLEDRVLEVYREPVKESSGRWKYRSVRLLKRSATVTPLATPRAKIRVGDLLP